ncbi:hypothetical protein [Maridesulfovibrio sp.]|uniref:hypothetical protein n=1 Tax=Maridesulfovibrio sp. TaxID=2795000 RepID=UPI0029C9D3CA|nr:hypothetical protein [Maridesulfovibrio sp.]
MKSSLTKVILKVLAAIGLFGLLTMWLWNMLLPDIFGLPEISLFQSIGLLVLTRLLFGGFGVLRDMGHFMARKERQAIFASWHSMTPEQRAEFIARARSRGGKKLFANAENAEE